jgi:hypothetical protein
MSYRPLLLSPSNISFLHSFCIITKILVLSRLVPKGIMIKRMIATRHAFRSNSRLSFRSLHTVLLFGDSLTWCYDPEKSSSTVARRIPFSQRWTTHLSEILGTQYVVIPEGLNGKLPINTKALQFNLFPSFTIKCMSIRYYRTNNCFQRSHSTR